MKATKNIVTYVILALLVILIAIAVCFSLVAAMDILPAHAETSGAVEASGTSGTLSSGSVSGTESGTLSGTTSDGKDIGTNVLKSLDIMWKGCLAIFIVIGLIILATVILNKSVLAVKKKREAQENNQSEEE